MGNSREIPAKITRPEALRQGSGSQTLHRHWPNLPRPLQNFPPCVAWVNPNQGGPQKNIVGRSVVYGRYTNPSKMLSWLNHESIGYGRDITLYIYRTSCHGAYKPANISLGGSTSKTNMLFTYQNKSEESTGDVHPSST